MRRVAITGIGAISALGRNTAEFAESLREGRCGIGPIESTDMSQMRFQNGAEVETTAISPISTTAARTSWTASRSSR